jgi:hypothetical protein
VPGAREPAHVEADLGHDHPGRERADAGDRGQQVDRGAKGREVLLDLAVDPGDRRLQRVDLVQVQPDPSLRSVGIFGRAPGSRRIENKGFFGASGPIPAENAWAHD